MHANKSKARYSIIPCQSIHYQQHACHHNTQQVHGQKNMLQHCWLAMSPATRMPSHVFSKYKGRRAFYNNALTLSSASIMPSQMAWAVCKYQARKTCVVSGTRTEEYTLPAARIMPSSQITSKSIQQVQGQKSMSQQCWLAMSAATRMPSHVIWACRKYHGTTVVEHVRCQHHACHAAKTPHTLARMAK